MAAGDRAGERYWQLPLIDDYVPEMDSWYGDLQNSGSAEGSLVKSGLFLREFVTMPWVHLDIAGTAYFRKATAVRAARRDGRLARDARRARARRRHGRLTAGAAGTAGARADGAAGLAARAGGSSSGSRADRFATRWPEHDEEHPPGRAVDWRTAVVARRRRVAFGLLPLRFGGDPLAFALFGAWFVTLVIGLATDLDQRLLPDVLTLPVIPVALRLRAQRAEPARRHGASWPAVAAAVAIPAVLYLPSIPFGAGAFGLGDVKLLVGVGLLVGGERALGGVVFALLLAGVVLVVLLATPPDRPADVRAVRAVLHHRRAVGGPHPRPTEPAPRVPSRPGPSARRRADSARA